MRWLTILGVAGLIGASGCAEQDGAGVALMQPSSTQEVRSVEVGRARVLEQGVDPIDGVRLEGDKNAIVAQLSPPRGSTKIERLDPTSLRVISHGRETADDSVPPVRPLRMLVDGGRRLIMLWKDGSGEWGYRVLAQAFNAYDHSPRGAPVVVSPIGDDVPGPISAVMLDDHQILAGFAASTRDGSFAAYVVPIKAL